MLFSLKNVWMYAVSPSHFGHLLLLPVPKPPVVPHGPTCHWILSLTTYFLFKVTPLLWQLLTNSPNWHTSSHYPCCQSHPSWCPLESWSPHWPFFRQRNSVCLPLLVGVLPHIWSLHQFLVHVLWMLPKSIHFVYVCILGRVRSQHRLHVYHRKLREPCWGCHSSWQSCHSHCQTPHLSTSLCT